MTHNHDYDVAVCGGGFGGISAALAAARGGKHVILFEKEYMLGGLGTAGLVTIYLPLCDGMGHQVSFGIAEELFRLSITYGAEARYPENWLDGVGSRTENDKRFLVQYNAQVFAILAEKLLEANGIDIMYGTYVVDTEVEDGKITALYTENKSGRTAYHIKGVVDATGDADVAFLSGAPTKNFSYGNVLAAWYYFTDDEGYKLKQLGASDISDEERAKAKNRQKPLSDRRFTGLDAKEISEFVKLAHEKTLEHWLEARKTNENAVISTIATIPQLRMTRRIVGEYELSKADDHKYFDDSIGMVGDWRRRGPVYEVPFTTLYSSKIKNLAMAGRCISNTDDMWDIMRVIPCCAVTGEAAGTALALSYDLTELDVKELQKKLIQNGVVLHQKDII